MLPGIIFLSALQLDPAHSPVKGRMLLSVAVPHPALSRSRAPRWSRKAGADEAESDDLAGLQLTFNLQTLTFEFHIIPWHKMLLCVLCLFQPLRNGITSLRSCADSGGGTQPTGRTLLSPVPASRLLVSRRCPSVPGHLPSVESVRGAPAACREAASCS